jgi:hypothetical protein
MTFAIPNKLIELEGWFIAIPLLALLGFVAALVTAVRLAFDRIRRDRALREADKQKTERDE